MAVRAVSNPVVKRDGQSFKLSWKWPSDAFKHRSGERYGFVNRLDISSSVNNAVIKKQVNSKNLLTAKGENNVKGTTSLTTGNAVSWNDMYPRGAIKSGYVRFDITSYGYPSSKAFSNGKLMQIPLSVYYSFQTPSQPTITTSFDAANGIVSFRIRTDPGNNERERYDTRYRVTRLDSANRGNTYNSEKNVINWTSSTSTDFTVTYDVSDHASILQDENITIKCYAYSRGAAGDSTNTATSAYTLAYPAQATISDITATSPANGTVTVFVSTNATKARPVTTAKLQRLYNTTIGVAETAAASLDWADVPNAVDNDKCSGFTDQKVSAQPEVRKHTWYRVATTYGALTVYGMPVEAKVLYRAMDEESAQAIKFRSMELLDDGSVSMALGWSSDNYTANEITWSSSPNAWESNNQPESFTMTWEDATPATGFAHSGRFIISGLKAGEPCYIRARRVFDDGETVMHGEWCVPPANFYPIDIGGTMGNVVLFAPESTVRDDGIDCQWAFDGEEPTEWTMYLVEGQRTTVLVSGAKSPGRCTVPAEKLVGLDAATLRLGLVSGGVALYSEDRTVRVYDKPTVSVSVDSPLEVQPLEIDLESSTDMARVRIYVTAVEDVPNVWPDGRGQVKGDTLWAESLLPEWTQDGQSYTATVHAPIAAFVDGSSYQVSVVALDESSGMQSEGASCLFDVEWEHQAEAPGDESAVTADAETMSAVIYAEEPENAEESASYALTEDEEPGPDKTYYELDDGEYVAVDDPVEADMGSYYERTLSDVCDVYRLTPDGCDLVYEGLEFGKSCQDMFAPYSSDGEGLAYRLCTRTADGDLNWVDVEYQLASDDMRVDFDNDGIDLPWGISASDGYVKPFELEERWDGSRVGMWNAGSTRTASLATAVMRIEGDDDVRAVRKLAQYSGPCFVRTPDGCAYEADVQVDTFGASFKSPVVPASIKATQIDLTAEYMAGELQPEEEGE